MKRILLLFVLLLALSGCGTPQGDVSGVTILEVPSAVYSQTEIDEAVDQALDYFSGGFPGCTMTEIAYAGDEQLGKMEEWADRYEADRAILLISSFQTDGQAKGGPLEPYQTYQNYNWIIVSDSFGGWKHVDHGY